MSLWNFLRIIFDQDPDNEPEPLPDLSLPKIQAEVLAPILIHWLPVNGQTRVCIFFALEPKRREEVVFLSKAAARLKELEAQEQPPGSPAAFEVHGILRGAWHTVPQVRALPRLFAGELLFVAMLDVPLDLLPESFLPYDHNGGFLRIRYNGPNNPRGIIEALAAVPASTIAWRRLEALQERGARPVDAQLIQANFDLFSPGTMNWPGMVLFSFDPAVGREALEALAHQIYEWKTTDVTEPDQLAAVAVPRANDGGWIYHRRFLVPRSLTGGATVYGADLWFHRPFVRGGILQDRVLPCLAEPGDEGGIELLPYENPARSIAAGIRATVDPRN